MIHSTRSFIILGINFSFYLFCIRGVYSSSIFALHAGISCCIYHWLLSEQGVVLGRPVCLVLHECVVPDSQEMPMTVNRISPRAASSSDLLHHQASIQVAMTLLDLGVPSILVQSQDRQMQNWAFFRLNSTWTLLILGWGFLQMEPKGLPWHDGCVLGNQPEHVRGWWTGK